MAGRINTTETTLTSAPRAISMHMELTMSMLEYTATPKVAANRPKPLVTMDGMDVDSAIVTASRLSLPAARSCL